MPGIAQIATAWKVFIGVIVPLKFAAFSVGYVAWMLAAPTGAKRRAALLEHLRSVVTTAKESSSIDEVRSHELFASIAKLEALAAAGWKSHGDLTTLLGILGFVSKYHAYETRDAAAELKSSVWKFLIDSVESMLPQTKKAA
jgi:hypothetical protein